MAFAEFLPDSQRLSPEALQTLPPAFRDPELPDPIVVSRSRTVQAQGFEALTKWKPLPTVVDLHKVVLFVPDPYNLIAQ